MFTLVVTNRKGGTAKTTTAVNLAAEFAKQGQRCLLIDLDTQGHSGLGLGVEPVTPDSRPHSILANGRQSLNNLLHETRFDNLFFIPPGQISDRQNLKIERLHKFLARKQLAHHFDIVVIDTPPNAGIEQTAALMSADAVVIPFLPSPLGKAGVQQLVGDMKNITAKNNRNHIPFGLIPIMLDSRVNLDNRILDEMISAYGTGKLLRGVRRNVKLAEAFDAGQPVNVFAARSRGAFDYHMLAEDIAALWPKILPRQNPLSFRKTAEIRILPPTVKKAANNNTDDLPEPATHRGIRLKDKCAHWNE
jgi:chromosome partitioning protein